MSDSELLRAYALEGSEAAFAALVNRYLALVHSVASRHLPDRALSEEVTQAVFVLLARKSHSLTGHPSIAGWLHRAAWQLAARTARTEGRRRRRELEAASTLPTAQSMPDLPEPATVLPALDAALQELQPADRDALVLRFFLRKPLRDVGAALGTSEAAAKMRIRRSMIFDSTFFVALHRELQRGARGPAQEFLLLHRGERDHPQGAGPGLYGAGGMDRVL